MGDEITPLFDGLKYPGHGYPERENARLEPLQAFFRLAKDQGLGKKSVIIYRASDELAQPSPVDMLEIRGDDLDATPLQVTLGQPLAVPRRLADLQIDTQNITGEFSAAQIGDADYPGTIHPIAWPPFVATIEWGVGGARSRAFVDFVNGATVNLGPASFVRVHAAVPPDAIHEPGTTGAYVLSAFIGPGRPRDGIAQRTIYCGQILAGAGGDVLVVPPFAKRATVIGCDVAPPNVTVAYVTFYRSPDATNPIGSFIVNGNQPLPFNVPNGGQYAVVTSGMVTPQRFALCFELGI